MAKLATALLGGALALLAVADAAAATLRPITTLAAPVVRLSDLFDDAGPDSARVLGPGPAPGARIVVESAQLAAIARQFGVDWRPQGGNERAVLERPGRLLPRETVVAALHTALVGVGGPQDGELELPNYAPPLVAAEAEARAEVEQLDYDGASGRFTASLTVVAEGMAPLRQRLAGTLHAMVDVPVLVRRLMPGSVIGADDVEVVATRASQLRGEVALLPEQAVGMAVRRVLAKGQPLALRDLSRPLAVIKGAQVLMLLRTPGLTVATQGVALEPGALGERIQVLNPSSRAIVEAVVIGADRVRVAPGSTPVTAAGVVRTAPGFAQVARR